MKWSLDVEIKVILMDYWLYMEWLRIAPPILCLCQNFRDFLYSLARGGKDSPITSQQ